MLAVPSLLPSPTRVRLAVSCMRAQAIADRSEAFVALRNARGMVRLCLTHNSKTFPDCKEPGSLHATITPALGPVHYRFHSIVPGVYSIVVFHDANGNGKLDTVMGIPIEGFAFSRNPKLRSRAPHFDETSFRSDGRPPEPLIMKYVI